MVDRESLSPAEARVVDFLASHVPAVFSAFDPDQLCSYARHWRGYKNQCETTAFELQKVLQWHNLMSYRCDNLLATPPSGRGTFERMYQAGPVGRDSCGRIVLVERIGAIPAREFCDRFSAEDVVAHSVYNREAQWALNRKLSHEEGRLIQRATPLIDLKGFGWQHLSRDFLHRTRVLIETLIHAYPDSSSGFFVINAPSLFSVLWKCIRPILDEETASMVKVLGGPSKYKPALVEMGVVLNDGEADLESMPVSWSASAADTAPGGVKPPPFVYEADSQVLYSAARSAGVTLPARFLSDLSSDLATQTGLGQLSLIRRLSSRSRSVRTVSGARAQDSPGRHGPDPSVGETGVDDGTARNTTTPTSKGLGGHGAGASAAIAGTLVIGAACALALLIRGSKA
jgi:hypothetical protein